MGVHLQKKKEKRKKKDKTKTKTSNKKDKSKTSNMSPGVKWIAPYLSLSCTSNCLVSPDFKCTLSLVTLSDIIFVFKPIKLLKFRHTYPVQDCITMTSRYKGTLSHNVGARFGLVICLCPISVLK